MKKEINVIKKMMKNHNGSDSVLIRWEGALTASPYNYKDRNCFYVFCTPTPIEVKEYKGKKWYSGKFPKEIFNQLNKQQ